MWSFFTVLITFFDFIIAFLLNPILDSIILISTGFIKYLIVI